MNHAVTIVGYSSKDEETPFWIVKNSYGTSWGDQGYIYIAITDGMGVCGINRMPAYPNILLQPEPLEFWTIVGCMSFALFLVIPFAIYELKSSVEDGCSHPIVMPYKKTIIFEGTFFALCWIFYALSILSAFTNYQFKEMVVFCFYCSLHLSFLSLHNCLALKSKAQAQMLYKHKGMSRCPLFTFSILLGLVMVIVVCVCFLNAAQVNFWSSSVIFATVHLVTLDSSLQILLYSSCAFVQLMKISQFFSVSEKKYLKPLAWFGLLVSVVIFCLFIMHIVTLIWFPAKSVLAALQIASLIWSSCVMLPLLHFMIWRHKGYVPTQTEIYEHNSTLGESYRSSIN